MGLSLSGIGFLYVGFCLGTDIQAFGGKCLPSSFCPVFLASWHKKGVHYTAYGFVFSTWMWDVA